jgi:hypothetical protein
MPRIRWIVLGPAAFVVSMIGTLHAQLDARIRFTTIVGACAVVGVAMAAALPAVSYASGSGFEEALLSPLSTSAPTTPASGASLFDKEVAVLTGKGISSARAMQAIEVQGKIVQTDIVRKVEANTADTFGGVWFEPATAQLHVGVTSPAGRQAAEEVIAGEGLAANVVVTSVRSTMTELLAVQDQWNRKLANLSVGTGVSTGIEPQHNAVVVKLDSSVSPSELAVLEREASAADVNVILSVVPGRRVVKPLAKTECKTWATSKAYCSPSITSGVTIQDAECEEAAEEVEPGFKTKEECENRTLAGKKGKWERDTGTCSAGPLAINTKKERVLLTAGHCITNAKEGWWSRDKAGEVEKRIGLAGTFVAGGPVAAERKGDYAEISIEPAWQTGKPNNPVFAVTAEWKKMNEKKEERSYPVKGEKTPAVGMDSCHVGQTSGESCGIINAVNVTAEYPVGGVLKFFNGLVEVVETKKETLEIKSGDSGGPELTIEEPSQEARMEGMAVAAGSECIDIKENRAGPRFYKTEAECKKEVKFGEGEWEEHITDMLFQPLRSVEKGPEGALDKLKLELLTTANEVIPCGG